MSSQLLISGLYDEQHVQVAFTPQKYTRNNHVQDYIKNQWNEVIKKNPSMFAGDLLGVKENNSDSKNIRLDTILTRFDDYYIVGTPNFQQKFPDEKNTNVLSAGCILVTSDNYLVFGKRSDKLVISPGKITIVSGMVDRNDVVDNKKADLFSCIKREIKEEVGVSSNEIHDLICIGLVNKSNNKGIFVPFFARLTISFEKLCEKSNDGELTELIKTTNSETGILKILEKPSNLSSVASASLQIYLELFSDLNKK